MQDQYEGQIQIIGVASRDGIEQMENFVAQTGVTNFPHAADDDGDIWEFYDIGSQPSFVFINDDGTYETLLGALGEDRLSERIEELLAT